MNTASTPLGFAGTPAAMHRRNFYLGLWRRVPKELGFLLLGLPIATVGYGVTIGLFTAGVGTLVTFFIGLILLFAALYVSRGFGTLELIRLEWAGQAAIERPDWQDAGAKTGFFGWLRAVLGNGHYWFYLLHTMIVDFVVSTVTWTITIVWTSVGLGGISYWFWGRFLPPQADNNGWNLSQSVLWLFGGRASAADYAAWNPFFYFVAGVVMLATLPFVTRALTLLHQAIARGMLGSFTSDALQRRVADLSESRGAAISAEGHSLRRLERDIHDGPQQRLVRLQMDLAAADRQLDADPEKARGLIGEAMKQSRDALDELRALSRGFAPPILMDRGLVAALESAAVRSTLPTRIVSELPVGIELPQEIERNAYFVASEALTNAAKHSSASSVEVTVGLRRLPESDETWLDVTITDDGRGGAAQLEGHGLAGLEERMRGLGGTLEVRSPEGGPTVVSAHLPVTASAPSSIGHPSTP
jgi:signal transduction histidine kinase